jgi:hypothetical protein
MNTTPKDTGPPQVRVRRLLLIVALVVGLALNLAPAGVALAAGNNLLTSATLITPPVSNDTTNTTTATRESNEIGNCGNFAASGNIHSVWYKYAPGSSGWLTVSTLGSSYDTVLEVFTGPASSPTFATLTSIPNGCNDDAGGLRQSEVTVPVTSGTTYYFVIRDYGNGTGGTAKFSAQFSAQHQIYINKNIGNDNNTGSMALPVKTLQRGVNLATSGTVVNVMVAGTYAENVTIAASLTIAVPSGAVTVNSFTLASGAAVTLSGPGTISAPLVTVQNGARVQDGVALASAGGTINAGNGTYAENLTIAKSLTLRAINEGSASIQPASGVAVTISGGSITLRGFNIQAGTGVVVSGGSGHTIYHNNIAGNTSGVGLNNTTGSQVNAAANWWGDVTGPAGAGDDANGNVKFKPWCDSPVPACTGLLGEATKLVFIVSPGDSAVGAALLPAPIVHAVDDANNLDTAFTGPITVTIKSGTGTAGAALSGTRTVNAAGGTATFPGLSIDKAGTNYQLAANNSTLLPGYSAVFTITKGDQTISFTMPASMAFTNTPFTISATASSGLTVSFSATGNCTVSGNSVTLTSVGSCTITADQGGDANWNPAPSVSQTFLITQGDQTITFNPLPDVPYGTAPFNVSASATSGLTVTFGVSGQCTISGNTVTITGVGTCTVTASQSGDANWNPAPDVPRTFNITKTNATVTLSNLSYTYDGNPHAATATTNPVSLTVVLTYTSATYGPTTAPPTLAGSYQVDAVVNDSNYQGSASGTLIIAKAMLTVTLGNLNQTYNGTPRSATATASQPVQGVDITYNGFVAAPMNAGSYTVVATINDPNYQGSASGTLIIAKAPATITLGSLTATYDGSQHPATATTNPPALTVDFRYNGVASAPVNVGSYTVVATIVNINYQGTTTGTLTINQASQTIIFGALANKVYGDPPFTVSASASSGLAVTFSATGQCAVAGATVTLIGVGSCTITASQSGNANYTAAASVARTFTIAKANQTINFAALQDRAYTNPPFTVSASASSGLGVTFSAAGQCTISGNTVTLTGALGSCTITASQSGNANYTAAAPVARTFSIVNSFRRFLPIIMNSPQADLVGSFSLSPNSLAPNHPVTITVTITNQGTVAASQFWVDFYINPSVPPTDTNQPWNKRCGLNPCYGIAWYISGTVEPGQSITLTSTPDSYRVSNTRWAGMFAKGTSDLYVYVDSWNPGVTIGAVAEIDETNNRAEYHGQPTSAEVDTPTGDLGSPDVILLDDLPPRPVRP